MKRCILWILVGACALGSVSLASAQQAPTNAVRLGDWVEIANDAFMNIIGQIDARYWTTTNFDFESRLRDVTNSRNPTASAIRESVGDGFQAEIRWGADFRYQKSLTAQIIFEQQTIFDGNLIDDTGNTTTPGCQATAASPCPQGIVGPSGEDTSPHIERFWIDYAFPGGIHMRVGADIWQIDQAGVIGDDDPRFTLYGKHGAFDWGVAAVIQNESARLGLTNDNDTIYYTFHAGYDLKPHFLSLDVAYFRDRFTGATGQARLGQQLDSVLIMPNFTARFGPVRALVQPMLIWGSAKGTQATGRQDFDIFAYGGVAALEADLGIVRPFVSVVYGSADDNPNDTDLEGFAPWPYTDVTQMNATPWFSTLVDSPSFGRRNASPGRAPGFDAEFRHTTSNPFSDRLGQTEHRDAAGTIRISTTYSNVGTLVIPAGVRILPLKGHEAVLFYMYVGMIDSALAESITARSPQRGRVNIKNTLYHEIGATWTWTLNPHFNIKLNGYFDIPADGVKAIASTQNCNTTGGAFRACQGEDIAIRGEVRFLARF